MMASLNLETATIDDLQQALTAGDTTAAALVRGYCARIETIDRAGPRVNAVRELNPDAEAIAAGLDAAKAAARRPLEGIPILVKDNIAPPTGNTRPPARSHSPGRGHGATPPSSGCCGRQVRSSSAKPI